MKLFSQKNKKQKGFTILFAVLVSSLVLALGLGIISITMKEVQLSGAGRDSQLAFYAADSGAECAFYWDLKGDYFSTSTTWSGSNQSDMKCNKQILNADTTNWSDTRGDGNPNSATTTFWFTMADGATTFNHSNDPTNLSKPCTTVTVTKFMDGINQKTSIDARGYNTCDISNKRRLERGYSIEY